ncbi:MAG: alcohol dehydrogenase catalytic domain-containing protein [Rhizobiales bacterium]|nr:alcohol dehydrogenase catalytic domain-containing protein [Hyphomicrobiales bacterium]
MSKAVFIHGPHDVRVGPYQPPPPRNDTVMLKVAAVGLCGSDLHYYKDGGIGAAVIAKPFVPGHEFAGHLVNDEPALGLPRGALVAVDPNRACGQCEYCLAGHANLCPKVEFIGAPPFDGAMTETIAVPSELVVPIPQGFTPLQAVMLEPLGVAIHAIDLAKPRLGESVALIGCGPIGLLILEVLKVAGAGDVFAIDPIETRRDFALKLGAKRAGSSVKDIVQWSNGAGYPLVIEATNSPDGFNDAVLAAKIGGRVVLVGIPDGNSYTLDAAQARRRGLKIKFSRRMGHVYPRAIDLVAQGKVDVVSMVTNEFALDDAPEAFRLHAEGAPGVIKSLIVP